MEEIRRSPVEVGSLSPYLQGFVHPRWCRIFSINSTNRLRWLDFCHVFSSAKCEFFGWCIYFFYLVTLQIRPSLYTGVIKLLDFGGIFINKPILRVFFSLKKHCLGRFHIHPRNLTWNLKISPWKRKVLLETMIFRFMLKFGGVMSFLCDVSEGDINKNLP